MDNFIYIEKSKVCKCNECNVVETYRKKQQMFTQNSLNLKSEDGYCALSIMKTKCTYSVGDILLNDEQR